MTPNKALRLTWRPCHVWCMRTKRARTTTQLSSALGAVTTMPKILKAGLWSLVAGLLVFVGFVWFLSANTPKRDRYLIPEGYAGWLCLTYSVSGAPPLEIEDGYRLVKFSPSGVIETSTEGMPGKYKDDFWFYGGNSLRQMNIEKEMGGAYTVAKSEAPDRLTFMFWVSQNAKEQQPPYSPEKTNRCGPSK